MQFTIYLNQPRAQEWGLNLSQAVFFSYLYEAQSWCDSRVFGEDVYYWISKEKVMEELPILSDKPDTIKRYLSALEKAGLILRKVVSNYIFVAITEKGKLWNRERYPVQGREKNPPMPEEVGKKIPTKGGKKSPLRGEKNPPYQYTNNPPTNNQSNKNYKKGSVRSVLMTQFASRIPEQAIDDAIEHRNAKRAANTQRSHSMFFDEVLACSQQLGLSPSAVIDIVIQRDWKGVSVDWVRNHLAGARNLPVPHGQSPPPQSPKDQVRQNIHSIHDTDW